MAAADPRPTGPDESRFRSEESRIGSEEPRIRSDGSRFGSEESRIRSDGSRIRSEESRIRSDGSRFGSEGSRFRSVGLVRSWESELATIQHSLKFVLKLKEEFVCPICRGVVLNPQQNSCGHIYCFHCVQDLLLSSSPSSPVCPVDGAVITPAEVFQDNCCKREISSLEVYCTNAPSCSSIMTLHNLQEHLRSCPYEQVPCTNPGCRAALQRRYLHHHMTICPQRMEACPHCQQPQPLSLMEDHIQRSCSQVKVDCPNSCSMKILRHMVTEHSDSCPEVHIECSYRRFGCFVQGKQGRVKLREEAAVNHPMLLVLRSNVDLEHQVELLQQEALLKQQEVHADSVLLTGLQNQTRPLLQKSNSHEHNVTTVQRALSRQEDVLSTIQLDVQQVSRTLGPGLEELEQLRSSLDAVIQEVSAAEALREQLGYMEENLKRHSGLLELHVAQLGHNKQRLQELGATSYNGKLIWKIQDFRKKSDAEVKGQSPCITSMPFYTGRCGYKMAVKAYLNGDVDGRGTHLSLYVVLMLGDFDALLPWPFRQYVSLSVMDQSGSGNHRTLSFRPDPASKSFHRPPSESISNVAVGFSCFILLS
uniref:TNF receptor-associated factor n=2 Tax=Sphaeramia orbicularis TaxID=375764 RepID=A0A673CEQ3_9TELE